MKSEDTSSTLPAIHRVLRTISSTKHGAQVAKWKGYPGIAHSKAEEDGEEDEVFWSLEASGAVDILVASYSADKVKTVLPTATSIHIISARACIYVV